MEYVIETQGKDEYLAMFYERAPLTIEKRYFTDTMKTVDLKAENIREELKRMFGEEDFNAVEEEIAAEWYGTAKTADLERFVDREAQKNPSLWETIKNKLREIVDDIMTRLTKLAKGNKTMANALKIAEEDRVRITEFCELVEKALGNAGNVRESEKGAGTEYKYSLAENARDDVNKVLQDVNYRQEVLLRNVTPPIILSHKNTRNLPMTMLASHVRSVVLTEDEARQLGLSVGANDHYHGLGVELFLNIIDNLDNVVEAYRGTKNAEQSERGENLFLLIAKVPSDNTEYFVPIYVNQKGNVNNAVIDVNKISSSYVKTDLRNYLQKNIRDGNIIRIKNRSTGDGDGTARLAGAYDTSASEDSISSSTEKSNSKKEKNSFALDSDGNDLTEEQAEYFKDSKVRDEDGMLLVMYHGTPNAGFTVFRSGTYFTQNKEYADLYQGKGASSLGYKKTANNPDTYAVYLNITKPFDTRNKKERDIFRREYLGKWGTGTDLMESGLPDWMDGMDLQEFLEENGYDYDGLILDEGGVGGYGEEVRSRGLSYVVFNANQVKDVANKTPTENEDINYSYALGSEDTAELEERTAGRKELEEQLDIIRKLAVTSVQKAAKTVIQKNGRENFAPKQNELIPVAEKAVLDGTDEKSQKQIATQIRSCIYDLYTGVKTSDTVVNELIGKIEQLAMKYGKTITANEDGTVTETDKSAEKEQSAAKAKKQVVFVGTVENGTVTGETLEEWAHGRSEFFI